MHEETRRRMLRAAFILVCLVPTTSVIAWSLVRSLPVHTRRLEQRLQSAMGAQIQIGSLAHPRPGHVLLSDVTIGDVESDRPLAVLPQVNAVKTDQGWRLIVPDASIPRRALRPLWQLAHQRFLRDDDIAGSIVHVSMKRLVIADESNDFELRDLNWSRRHKPDVQQSLLVFALPDSLPSQGVKLELFRDRSRPLPQTRIVLETRDTSLPVSLMLSFLGSNWNTQSTCRGRVAWVSENDRWHAQFDGQLAGLELIDLAPTWIPFEIRGQALINIDDGTFDASGIQSVHGTLNVHNFVAPRSLIDALVRLNVFEEGPAFAGALTDDEFKADVLDLAFAMNEMGLSCKGVPDRAGLPVAAVGAAGPLLLSDARLRINYLICALIPETMKGVYRARARLMKALPATLPRSLLRSESSRP